MSPHPALDNHFFGNGLSGRVSACRKRLRSNRLTQMAIAQNQVEEILPETPASESEFYDHPADGGVSKDRVRIDCCSIEFESTEPIDRELWLLVGEQEVGIT